mgnify:FL=1|jgi:hypothetical protein
MAINVDTVYKTVLLILNKEQRGYVTPDEFNKIGTQVQLEIFEKYFEDLNQQLRVPQADSEYADRQKNIDNNISIFKTIGDCSYNSGGYFMPPSDLHRIGTVIYKDEKEIQRVQRNELLNINMSKLTKPTTTYPIYVYEDGSTTSLPRIYVYPKTITNSADISVTYVRKPQNVTWAYQQLGGGTWTSGPYIYNPSSSTNFELDAVEQTNVITNILLYMGIVINDPQVIQIAAQQAQAEEVNKKS